MNIPNLPNTPESIKTNPITKELIYFKEEILRDLKSLESKMNLKIKQQTEETDRKISNIESKTDNLTQRIFTLSNKFTDTDNMKLNIDALLTYRTKLDQTLFSQQFKSNTLAKELKETINRYDKIINDNIIYPGIIGTSGSRFANMRFFIDFVLSNLKDKSFQMDLKSYKVKIDGIIENLKSKIDEISSNNNFYIKQSTEKLDKKFSNILNIYDEKLTNIRIENSKSYQNLENYSKNLIEGLDQIHDIKNELTDLFNGNISDIKNALNINEIKYNEFQKTFLGLQSQFNDLKEWLKDFRVLGKEMPSRLKNDTYKSKMSHAESYLKKYIEGEVTMNDLVHRKYSDKEKCELEKNMFSPKNKFLQVDNKFKTIDKNENLNDKFLLNGEKNKDVKNKFKNNSRYDENCCIYDDFLSNNKTQVKAFRKSFTQQKIQFNFGDKKDKNGIIYKNNEFDLENEGKNNNNLLRNNGIIKSAKKNNRFLQDFSYNKNVSDYNQISNFVDKMDKNDVIFNNDLKIMNNKENDKNIEKDLNYNFLGKSSNYEMKEMEKKYDNNQINSNDNKNKEIKNNGKINEEKDKILDNNNPVNLKNSNLSKKNSSLPNLLKIENEISKLKQNSQENNNLNNPLTILQMKSSSSTRNFNKIYDNKFEDKKDNNDKTSKSNNNYTKKEMIDVYSQRETKRNQNLINPRDKAVLHKILKGERECLLTFDLVKKEDKTDSKNNNSRNNIKTPIKSKTNSAAVLLQDSNMIQGKLHYINLPIKKKIKIKEIKKDEKEGIKIISGLKQMNKDIDIKKKRGNQMRSADKIYCVNMP